MLAAKWDTLTIKVAVDEEPITTTTTTTQNQTHVFPSNHWAHVKYF